MDRRSWTVFVVALWLAGSWETGWGSVSAEQKRDPFVPLVRDGRIVSAVGSGTLGDFSELTLAGILWDPAGRSIALINGTEVKAGDVLGEYQVAEIRQDAVVLMRERKPVVLQLSFETAEPPATSKQKKRR